MKGKYIIVSIILLLVVGIFLYFYLNKMENNQQIANPAAKKCVENGGTLTPVEFKEGTDSFCTFEDGSVCWEWDFYRGDCSKGDLKIETITEGQGVLTSRGDEVSVHYTGRLESGTVFDSSVTRGTPFSFTLGSKQVISGWEYGILGMKIGEKRILTISPKLGYGSSDYGPIPGNSTLIFEVELLGIN
jgi:putative hemolysin